jgi:hypothetical protein
MSTLVYGRAVRSSGGSSGVKHRRQFFATDPARSTYIAPKPGFVGPPAQAEEARTATSKPYTNPHLRLRYLPCGHKVFMMRGQFPDAETFCLQCRDGRPIR